MNLSGKNRYAMLPANGIKLYNCRSSLASVKKRKRCTKKKQNGGSTYCFLLKEYPAIMALAVTLKTVEDDYKSVEAN